MHIWHNDADNYWSTYEMFKLGIILNSGGIQGQIPEISSDTYPLLLINKQTFSNFDVNQLFYS